MLAFAGLVAFGSQARAQVATTTTTSTSTSVTNTSATVSSTTTTSSNTTSTSSTTSTLPPALRCQAQLTRELGVLRGKVTACYTKSLQRRQFDRAGCIGRATAAYDKRTSALTKGGQCPSCVSSVSAQLRDRIVAEIPAGTASLDACSVNTAGGREAKRCAVKLRLTVKLAKRVGVCRNQQLKQEFARKTLVPETTCKGVSGLQSHLARITGCACIDGTIAGQAVATSASQDSAEAFCACPSTAAGPCDDNSACTNDWCDGNTCQHDNINENKPCAALDKCQVCRSGRCDAPACPSSECSIGTCDPATGQCGKTPTNEGTQCASDGKVCTKDLCLNGNCEHQTLICTTPPGGYVECIEPTGCHNPNP